MSITTTHSDDSTISRLSHPLPNGTIDSHMHIIPPDFTRFPLHPSATYTPTPHTLDQARAFYESTSGLGITNPRCVLTQVSIYGNDNSALLSGLAELKGNGRGVIQFDPNDASIGAEKLAEWWEQGARGVRLNLVSVGATMSEVELKDTLQRYVDVLVQHELGGGKKWVVEMYLPLTMVPSFRVVLPRIKGGEKVGWCLDHFAGLKFKEHAPNFRGGDDVYSISGISELVELLTSGGPEVYVKISAQYRMDALYPAPESLRRIGSVAKELITRAEDRVMWASDWPHTRFENIDSVLFVEVLYRACGDGEEGLKRREKLFRVNAEMCWDMSQ